MYVASAREIVVVDISTFTPTITARIHANALYVIDTDQNRVLTSVNTSGRGEGSGEGRSMRGSNPMPRPRLTS